MSMNIYVTHRIHEAGLKIVQAHCGAYDMNPDERRLSQEELIEHVRGRDGVLCILNNRIDVVVLDAAGPQCKVFANYGSGVGNIDVAAATQRGVAITHTPLEAVPGYNEATADHAWALLFSVARRIAEADRFMRSGQWTGWGPMQFLGADVTGRTLGVVGAGQIGTLVAMRSRGFDMNVLYFDKVPNPTLEKHLGARRVELNELLAESDFVTIHVKLLPETTHLINAESFQRMKDTAILVNAARGPIVDEKALLEALQKGEIAGAGMDVYENEPRFEPGLGKLDNVVMTPHLGVATHGARSRMAELAARDLVAVLKGERPEHCVNPEVIKKQ